MQIVLLIHSILRWLIVLAGGIALIKFAIGWIRDGEFKGMDRGLTAGFNGLMDLQVTLGLILLLWNGLVDGAGFPRHRLEHLGILLAAAIVGHLQVRWKNAPDRIRFRNSFFVILAVLALIAAGVAVLPGGWSR